MKILKKGKKIKWIVTCNKCECQFEIEDNEASYGIAIENNIGHSIRTCYCPNCKRETRSNEDSWQEITYIP